MHLLFAALLEGQQTQSETVKTEMTRESEPQGKTN